MKKLDAIHKTSFKEEACLFYQDFIAKENKGEAAERCIQYVVHSRRNWIQLLPSG